MIASDSLSFFFSSRRRHTRLQGDWSSDVCSSDLAGPTVAFGIEAPGHFAQGSITGGSGSYSTNAVGGGTYGLSGVYTAKVGGLWDGLLSEGRNSFIFISSDWHNRGAGGARDSFTTSDFIPGEYTKLYVPNSEHFRAQSIVDGMRSG